LHIKAVELKKTDLEKLKGKKITGGGLVSVRGGQGEALSKREQALERKRELLRRLQKPKA
jgi:hypothetical protein